MEINRLSTGERAGKGRLVTGIRIASVGVRRAPDQLGVWNDVVDRLVRAEDVRSALMFVARGEAPLGIVYLSRRSLHAAASASTRGHSARISSPPVSSIFLRKRLSTKGRSERGARIRPGCLIPDPRMHRIWAHDPQRLRPPRTSRGLARGPR
jgi:hypothetical protein